MWQSRRLKRVFTSLSAVTVVAVGISMTDIVENNPYGPVSFDIVDKAYAEIKTELDNNAKKIAEEKNEKERDRLQSRPPRPLLHYGPPPHPRPPVPPHHYGPAPMPKFREVKVLWGDVNSDEKIDKKDSQRLKDYINDKKEVFFGDLLFDTSIADVNGDGKVDMIDVDYINAYLAGISILGNRTGTVKEVIKKREPYRPLRRYGGAPPPPRIAGRRQYTPSGEKKKDSAEVKIKAHSVADEAEIRTDGKVICNILREKRLELATLNNIAFKSDLCPSIEPCAGTCPKCDAEAEYLKAQLKKLPKDQIVYPKLDVSDFR